MKARLPQLLRLEEQHNATDRRPDCDRLRSQLRQFWLDPGSLVPELGQERQNDAALVSNGCSSISSLELVPNLLRKSLPDQEFVEHLEFQVVSGNN